jgi:hypothetical protein
MGRIRQLAHASFDVAQIFHGTNALEIGTLSAVSI